MKIKSLLLCGLLTTVMFGSIVTNANASTEVSIGIEAATVDVTVPTSLALMFKADGTTVIPTLPVVNNSTSHTLALENLVVNSAGSGWKFSSVREDIVKKDSKIIGLSVKSGDNFNASIVPNDGTTSTTASIDFADNGQLKIAPSETINLDLGMVRGVYTTDVAVSKAFDLQLNFGIIE